MALPHLCSGDLLEIRPLGSSLRDAQTQTLVPGPPLELFRLVLLAGKSVPTHHVPGPLTIQCIEGIVELELPDRRQTMHPGDLVYLAPKVPHGLQGIEDASVLVTLLRLHEGSDS